MSLCFMLVIIVKFCVVLEFLHIFASLERNARGPKSNDDVTDDVMIANWYPNWLGRTSTSKKSRLYQPVRNLIFR